MKYLFLAIALILSLAKLYSQKNYFQLPVSIPSIHNPLIGGAPGPSSRIMIRCSTGTVSDGKPLFVVDGIPFEASDIKSINPADILEITILKTASAAIYGNRALNEVVIITTKKQYHREIIIRDAMNLLGVSNATVEARSNQTGKSFFFTADQVGKLETDSLRSNDYIIRVSAVGYKAKEVSLKMIQHYKGEIKLEREFVELTEINIVAYQTIRCRSMSGGVVHKSEHCGSFICSAVGIQITNISEETKISNSININKAISVYPNPVAASGTINFSFPNVKPGQYQARMLSAAGQLLYSFQKQISGKGETEQIHLNSNTLPGMYIVQVIDEQKKLLQTSKIVVQ